MSARYFTPFATVVRVLFIGTLSAILFAQPQWPAMTETLSFAHPVAAILLSTIGVGMGFRLFSHSRIPKFLMQIEPVYPILISSVGFLVAGLWLAETRDFSPLAFWFLPAGVIEALGSVAVLSQRSRAN